MTRPLGASSASWPIQNGETRVCFGGGALFFPGAFACLKSGVRAGGSASFGAKAFVKSSSGDSGCTSSVTNVGASAAAFFGGSAFFCGGVTRSPSKGTVAANPPVRGAAGAGIVPIKSRAGAAGCAKPPIVAGCEILGVLWKPAGAGSALFSRENAGDGVSSGRKKSPVLSKTELRSASCRTSIVI